MGQAQGQFTNAFSFNSTYGALSTSLRLQPTNPISAWALADLSVATAVQGEAPEPKTGKCVCVGVWDLYLPVPPQLLPS